MLAEKEFYETCFQTVKKTKPALRPLTEADLATPLKVIGLDSLDVMNFLLELELATSLRLEAVDPKTHDTFKKMYSFLAGGGA